ncbi:hypothetical protein [Ferrimonas marina]|uniref:KfrA N-terminal DNA-binding domain-containing protein n=1 Tax=Ferrimonas marina TaxID=299255 RepID=A0A1M5YGC0_9GAMM|nr:hypothetical protein [Ferrimonas marina]SHI10949.1 hypothetical protein SAMN02745129_4204 [Ferrimonas marina]
MDPVIHQALSDLHRQGVSPTLARLKSKTGHSFPMPVLIQALKQWKANPQPLEAEPALKPAEPTAPAPDLAAQVAALQQRLTELEREVAELKARRD